MGEGAFVERERLRNVGDAIPYNQSTKNSSAGEVFHVRLRDALSTVPYRGCAVGVERFFAPLRMTVSFCLLPDNGVPAKPALWGKFTGEANDSTIPWLPLRRELAKP